MKTGTENGRKRFSDEIIGEKIFLYDSSSPGSCILREILIVDNEGQKHEYVLKKTKNGKYLLNT
jgi:hypothetical protein